MLPKERHTALIKAKASELGFMHCGISKAGFLESDARHLETWLNKGMHGKMSYMENYFDKRLDPTILVPGAKSVISLLLNYFPSETQTTGDAPKISRYAYGVDYHFVIKDKLNQLLQYMRDEIGDVDGRAFVDSAPVLDRAWAARSGLGWIGKNANLINRKSGSYFFIAELIVDLELLEDGPVTDHCGTCTRCIDACPTDAITDSRVVDGSRCISYLTIELKDAIPEEFAGRMEDWVFGCDICQEVCPWNRFSAPHNEPMLAANPAVLEMSRKEWSEMTEDVFRKVFKGSAVKRTGFKGLTRNLKFSGFGNAFEDLGDDISIDVPEGGDTPDLKKE